MKPMCIFVAAVGLLLLSVPILSRAAVGHGIKVVVKGLRDDSGRVGCSLFKGPNGFPGDRGGAFRDMWASKHEGIAVCDFSEVPPGTYAVDVIDDSNSDGKMDFNLIGLPTKGYGFSNDAKARLAPPSFEAASFNYNGEGSLEVAIHIVYWTS
jgi:uncharacterized protein (DUF2141 family)